jgi:hypothetical protein
VRGEQFPVDARFVVVALEEASQRELDQVPVAVFSAASSVRRAFLGLRGGGRRDVDLATENRLDTGLAGLALELDRPGHGAVIAEPDRPGISNSAARAASAGTQHVPSRMEYSEWT